MEPLMQEERWIRSPEYFEVHLFIHRVLCEFEAFNVVFSVGDALGQQDLGTLTKGRLVLVKDRNLYWRRQVKPLPVLDSGSDEICQQFCS